MAYDNVSISDLLPLEIIDDDFPPHETITAALASMTAAIINFFIFTLKIYRFTTFRTYIQIVREPASPYLQAPHIRRTPALPFQCRAAISKAVTGRTHLYRRRLTSTTSTSYRNIWLGFTPSSSLPMAP